MTEWNNIRTQAAITCLNALLETTQHSVLECLEVKDIYAKTAVLYADALVKALKELPIDLENKIKQDLKKVEKKI